MLSRLLYVLCICTYAISCLVEPQSTGNTALYAVLALIQYPSLSIHLSLISLLIDTAVHDGQANCFSSTHTHTHTHTPTPHPPIQRAADLPPPYSSEALVRSIVFGTLEGHCDDHLGGG